MKNRRYYDPTRDRLIWVQDSATPDYWDRHWDVDESLRDQLLSVRKTEVTRAVQQYLRPEDGCILEGGCGTGIHVAALVNNGYCCIGVDYAPATIKVIQSSVPSLDIRLGDVRALDFGDESFVGYWSGGVIEHFWDGYDEIAREMSRVVRPGGYLFVVFPYLSPLRRLKAALRLYSIRTSDEAPDGFYQFALNEKSVEEKLMDVGFRVVARKPMLGLRAAKEEFGPLNPLFRYIHENANRSAFIKAVGSILSTVLTRFGAHTILLTMVKER